MDIIISVQKLYLLSQNHLIMPIDDISYTYFYK